MEEKKMKAKKLLALLLAMVMVLSLAACVQDDNPTVATDPEGTGVYTYNTYLTLSPSNWNELTYQDNNDTNIMSYIGSSFFGYDFKFDANGEIVPGEFEVTYEAATKLEDVTAKYAEAWGLPADGKAMAYAITLRNDLKWENGDPIKAEDFVYTMQEQLNPLFQNYRADSFYVGATIIVNAQEYVKQGQSGWFAADTPYATYSADLDDKIIFALGPVSDTQAAAASFRLQQHRPSHRRSCITHLTGTLRATLRSASCFVPGRGQ